MAALHGGKDAVRAALHRKMQVVIELRNVCIRLDQTVVEIERVRSRKADALDTRDRDLEMRENLLKAAQMRLEAKVAELKDVEGRINTAMGNRDQAEAQRFKNIVSMYENMKPKDAARIFDRLDLKILVDVSTQMNSRKMSEILAVMSPDAAERLTVELANRAGTPKSQNPDQLPKIEGAPNGS